MPASPRTTGIKRRATTNAPNETGVAIPIVWMSEDEKAPRGDATGRPSPTTIPLNLATHELPPRGSERASERANDRLGQVPRRQNGNSEPALAASWAGRSVCCTLYAVRLQLQSAQSVRLVMILPQVHPRKPCYDFYFL